MLVGIKSMTILVALVALCVFTSQCEGTGANRAADGKSTSEEQAELRLRHNNRLLAVPYSLARFLAYNSRAGGNPAAASPSGGADHAAGQLTAAQSGGEPVGRQLAGYKRSSSALDALTGVTLGKRSTNPLEFVNFEPVFGRQSYSRGPPRVYDMRWAPFDSIESTPNGYSDYN